MRVDLRLLLACWVTVGACTEPRAVVRQGACVEYREEIQPLLTEACERCHGAALAEGNYRVDSYRRVIALRDDGTPRVVPGDAGSMFLARAAGIGHRPTDQETFDTLERWVTECNLNYLSNALVHPAGWVDPTSADFHGGFLRDSGWDLQACGQCHGDLDDPAGGASDQTSSPFSCLICHENGPDACNTCHGNDSTPAPPRAIGGGFATDLPGVGAHRTHVEGGPILGLTFGCDACHVVPTDWLDVGHIFLLDGRVDPNPRAEVRFGSFAGRSVPGHEERRIVPPSFNAITGSCSNVYCHGGALAASNVPRWTTGKNGADGCSTCHDIPLGGIHVAGLQLSSCAQCHGVVVDDTGAFVDATRHLDGNVDLGDGTGSCSTCHGSSANAAPPLSIRGETSAAVPAVGAHQSHVVAGRYRGPIPCGDCHKVPTGATFDETLRAPGHVDSPLPAEVFPGVASFGGLATRDGTVAFYDRTDSSCVNYCHGAGSYLAADATTVLIADPIWTDSGMGTVVCGTCHGLPPDTGVHDPSNPLFDACETCHSSVVDATGAIKFAPDGTTRHINGRADFNL